MLSSVNGLEPSTSAYQHRWRILSFGPLPLSFTRSAIRHRLTFYNTVPPQIWIQVSFYLVAGTPDISFTPFMRVSMVSRLNLSHISLDSYVESLDESKLDFTCCDLEPAILGMFYALNDRAIC